MWPFQNQQVWTEPLPAERASWCLTSAAFNDCLSAESSSSDNLCANPPLWLETQVVTLPFAPHECWQSCDYNLKLQKVIFATSIDFSAAADVLLANSCTYICCDSFYGFHVPLCCGLFLLINKTWHCSQFEGYDVCVSFFFLHILATE